MKAVAPTILITVILLAVAVVAEAGQPGKIPRMAYLAGFSPGADEI